MSGRETSPAEALTEQNGIQTDKQLTAEDMTMQGGSAPDGWLGSAAGAAGAAGGVGAGLGGPCGRRNLEGRCGVADAHEFGCIEALIWLVACRVTSKIMCT